MTNMAEALNRFNVDNLKRELATAVEEHDEARAAQVKAELDRLAPPPSKAKETR